MGRAKEDQPESSSLEGCCCDPLFHKESRGISQVLQCPVVLATLKATVNRLVGLVVRRPPRERKIPGSNPAYAGIFSGSSHTRDLKIGTGYPARRLAI